MSCCLPLDFSFLQTSNEKNYLYWEYIIDLLLTTVLLPDLQWCELPAAVLTVSQTQLQDWLHANQLKPPTEQSSAHWEWEKLILINFVFFLSCSTTAVPRWHCLAILYESCMLLFPPPPFPLTFIGSVQSLRSCCILSYIRKSCFLGTRPCWLTW